MIDINAYKNMTWETPSDELEDAIENLLAEVKRLREGIKAYLDLDIETTDLAGLLE